MVVFMESRPVVGGTMSADLELSEQTNAQRKLKGCFISK
jgi:hypothetical protein